MTRSRIHILGVGSIGALVAHHLRLSSPTTPISLLVRSPSTFPKELSSTREGIKSVSGGYQIESSIPTPNSEEDYWSKEPISNLLVTTKTIQTLSSIKPLKSRLDENSTITILQNGMGVHQELIDNLWRDERKRPNFILGTTPHAVSPAPEGKGQINHNIKKGGGFIKWGLVHDPYKNINGDVSLEDWLWSSAKPKDDVLTKDKFDPSRLEIPEGRTDLISLKNTITNLMSLDELNPEFLRYSNLNQALLLKLIVNASVNPVTAILGKGRMLNGKLLEIEEGKKIVDSIIRESSEILLKYLSAQPIQPERENLELFGYKQLREMVYKVIESTRTNITSMAVDIREKRKTEIDYINGYLVKLGNDLGCETKINQIIVDMIKFMETSQGDSEHF